MMHPTAWEICTDVSEEYTALTFRMEVKYYSRLRQICISMHDVTSHKAVIFKNETNRKTPKEISSI
jgi:hypothetical protein